MDKPREGSYIKYTTKFGTAGFCGTVCNGEVDDYPLSDIAEWQYFAKPFSEHFRDSDKIRSVCFPVTDPQSVNRVDIDMKMYDGCEFVLSKESGGYGYEYWVAVLKDGIEIHRWNTKYLESIEWVQ